MYKKVLLAVCLFVVLLNPIQAQDIDSKIDDIKTALVNGNYEIGLNECKALIESNLCNTKQLAVLYGYAGLSSEVMKQKTEAINYYKKAVELQMPQLDVYDKLISLSKKEKNDSIYEFALLEKARAFPEYKKDIAESLAFQYLNTTQYEKLLNTVNELLSWNSNDINALYFKGIALQNLNQAEEAKKYYSEVIKLDTEHLGANIGLGMILYNEGSEIFAYRKKVYESKAKPDGIDYLNYNNGIEEGKDLYRQALPYLLKAYESGSYPDLKQILFNTYTRLEQKQKREAYR